MTRIFGFSLATLILFATLPMTAAQADHIVSVQTKFNRCEILRTTGTSSIFVFEAGLRSQTLEINDAGELIKAICVTGEVTSAKPLFWSEENTNNNNCVANSGGVACACRVVDTDGHEFEVSHWNQVTNKGGSVLTCYGPDSGTFP